MTERAERCFPDRAEQEREYRELIRLDDVEGFIQRNAYKFAMGDPMLVEDLAQEGREAAIRQLRESPDCPTSHLIVKAKDAIYDYRRRGSSVDGKLYPNGRAKHYHVSSLEKPTADDKHPQGETIGDPQAPRRLTEERACTNILFACLRDNLSEVENKALTLRLDDCSWKEVGEILGKEAREMGRIRTRITATTQLILGFSVVERC